MSETSDRTLGSPVESCPKELINARWEQETVKCGDNAGMLADTVNIAAGVNATFTITAASGGGTVATEISTTMPSSVRGTWLSKKSTSVWNNPEDRFSVTADGLTAQSQDPQLSIHIYPDIAQASLTRTLQAPPGSSNFRWDEKVHIEFTNRKLILTVKVRLLNRTQNRPERGKKESYADYEARCNEIPVSGAVPDASKQSIKSTVEGVYRDQWNVHRRNCGRGSACDCDRAKKCCKFEIEVRLEFVETAGSMVNDVNMWPGTGRADSANWHRIESRPGKSWAHEVGHLMGFYDEYSEGATGSPPWRPNVPSSIMGSGTEVLDYHLEEFRAWFSGQAGEEFNLLRN